MATFTYTRSEISFDCPSEGVIFEFQKPKGEMLVRYQTKKENKTAVRIDIQLYEYHKTDREAADFLFDDRARAPRDAVDVAPYKLVNAKEKGWRLRKWMVDGSRFLGIIDCAFLQKGEKIYKISYFAPVKLFYSGQKAFNQIVETFEIK